MLGGRMEYLSITQIAQKWGISSRRIMCIEKIPGAMRIGNYWAVPADAERPKDGRIKSGRYIKLKKKQ